MIYLGTTITVLWYSSMVSAGRILFHIPTPTYSHNIVYEPIVKAMANRGHELVLITTYPMKSLRNLSNVVQIDVSSSKEYWRNNFNGAFDFSMKESIWAFGRVMSHISDIQLDEPEVQKIISNKSEHFDMVITECVWYHPTFGWAYRFKAPLVGILSTDLFYDAMDFLGNPSHPYLTHTMLMDFPSGTGMTFFERMKSLYIAVMVRTCTYLVMQSRQNAVLRKHFGENSPGIYELGKNMSLLIINQHDAMNPRPKVPKIVYMNMLHINPPKTLPSELKDFLDSGPDGVVYFSLGSNIKSSSLPQERIATILQAFGNVPYKVLWKWEQRQLFGKPPNVMLCQWCPQQDILDHKNVRLFITQGGMQSTEEAIYFKVPMLGLPLLVDQRNNVFKMVSRGCARRLDLNTLTKQDLADSIMKIMTNSSYQECINNLSDLMADQPEKPLDRVVWWLEYVLRHKGTPHFQVAEVPWYLYLMLDGVAVFLTVLILSFCCFKMLFKKIHHYLTAERSVERLKSE